MISLTISGEIEDRSGIRRRSRRRSRLPPGGFLTLGIILVGFGWWEERHKPARQTVRQWTHGIDPGEIAAPAGWETGPAGIGAPGGAKQEGAV